MILWILAYLGGLLTILSPCILPVLPFVFSRADQPFRKSTLPMLLGMATTFALFSTLAVVGGDWVVHANEWGRGLAVGVLAVFALTLIFPSLAERVTHPLSKLGSNLSSVQGGQPGAGRSFLLGIATGLLWAPCAGPILGLILTGAALQGANIGTTALLFAYAMGAVTSLAAALAVGGKFLKTLKKYLGADIWVRRVLGTAVLVGVLAISLGWDRGVLTQLSRLKTESLEQKLVQIFHTQGVEHSTPNTKPTALSVEGDFPELTGAVGWLNSPPLTREGLLGKVVLVDFWTYSCINCLRSLPYIQAWAEKYRDAGLVVIGAHTPEFAFEKNVTNVEKAVHDFGLTYPVVIDSNFKIWRAFKNSYWPAHYFIDAKGKIRHHHYGEGEYEESERVIQELLAEKNGVQSQQGFVQVQGSGVQSKSVNSGVVSPETYVGYRRTANLKTIPPTLRDQAQNYLLDGTLGLNQWGLEGRWKIQSENAVLLKPLGKITFRFHARDLHLVLGPGSQGKAIRFRVQLDGANPKENHGVDIDETGTGSIHEHRLYQLIRQPEVTPVQDRTFEIEFLDAGAEVFAFTFG
jgi:cytochrome c biogenesis protein CcdA/thiol-disulfide isomerase/thioredoxin